MVRWLAIALVMALLPGCKKSATALMEDQLAAMKGVTAVLETIQDDATAEAALPKLESAAARLKSANKAAARTATSGNRDASPENIQKAMEMAKPLIDAGMQMTVAAMTAQGKAPRHANTIARIVNSAGVDPTR